MTHQNEDENLSKCGCVDRGKVHWHMVSLPIDPAVRFSTEEGAIHFMADFLHFCEVNNIDFDELLNEAREQYAFEIED